MDIYCHDNTAGKLWLASDFLAALGTIADDAQVYICSDESGRYADLSRLYPQLKFTTKQRPQYHIAFFSTASADVAADIQFPVIFAEQGIESCPGTVPLAPAKHGYRIGEADSALLLVSRLFYKQDLQGLYFLITAGPTAEDIDPVRFLTNRSTGKMGIALARAAWLRGAEVELVLGPTREEVAGILNTTKVRSAKEMADCVKQKIKQADVYIGAAAIADYTMDATQPHKIKKSNRPLQLKLKRTEDIISTVAAKKQHRTIVGFSVETENVIENSLSKLERKNLDMIVVNNPHEKGSAFAADTNKVAILHKNGQMFNLPLASKESIAHTVLDHILKQRGQRD